jgi:outer membrane protein assembly factor BamB
MIKLGDLHCPKCGADLPVPAPGTHSIHCQYCGHESQVIESPKEAPPPPPPVQPAAQYPLADDVVSAPAVSSSSGAGVVLGIVIVAAVVLGLIGALVGSRTLGSDPFQWRATALPAAINSDGVEDFVGIYASRSEKDYPIYVAAFDGASRKELWRSGPYGTSAYETKYAVAASWVVIADPNAKAHVLALTTGKELGAFALTDKADELCVAGDAKAVWVGCADQKGVTIDLASLTAREAPRPAACPKAASDCRNVHTALAGCADGDLGPKVEGLYPEAVLQQGDDGVVFGTRSPGTPTPMAVGFDPKSQSIRWQKPLVGTPTTAWDARLHAVDMADGRLFAEYVSKEGKAGRLMALDVKTGAVLWDVPVPNTDSVAEASEMTISATRVYLPHWTWLDIFDVKTGAHIDTLGAW